ncbi:hypothetical protein SCLCIDRAFT_18912 [Scleroderma citrinum Foug A]|uniref:Uncharacterized protein n=1 Tax=Scleroderma citrinum Foug A TaxID=1036808 RepID=A0A0C3A847_9AGAM|nr:hypothetical protein SCLCIDRAFT_18912 [Scleroderma citrinum Foug A]
MDPTSVSVAKSNIGSTAIGAALSPYFSQHKAVVQGLVKLHCLFWWRAVWSNENDTDLNPHTTVIPPPDTDYIHIINILKDIRDNIDPALDGCPSDAVYQDAKAHYDQLLKSGNINEPLLGDVESTSTAVTMTASRSHKQATESSCVRASKRQGQGAWQGDPQPQP